MGTTPVTPAPIHTSFWARAATWIVHEASVVKSTIAKIATITPAVSAEIAKVAPTVEDLSNLVVPNSANFESHLVDVWSVAAAAVDSADQAAQANGVNVTLDANLVNQIKGFIPAVKAKMSGTPSPTA